jgi:hypothetical protein
VKKLILTLIACMPLICHGQQDLQLICIGESVYTKPGSDPNTEAMTQTFSFVGGKLHGFIPCQWSEETIVCDAEKVKTGSAIAVNQTSIDRSSSIVTDISEGRKGGVVTFTGQCSPIPPRF